MSTPHTEITLTAGVDNYRLPAPEWGYTTDLSVALIHSPVLPRGYSVWDNGSSNDFRVCTCTFVLDSTDANTMATLFRDGQKGRALDLTLHLPSGSGFFPFGPDKGDTGAYTVRAIDFRPGKQLEEPYGYYRYTVSMVCTSYPVYGLPTEVSEGGLTIGTISELRWPPDWPETESRYDVSTQLTDDGTPYSVNKMTNSYEAMLGMICNESKAAALLNHLVGTVRDGTLTITPPANTCMFGRENGAGPFTCRWLDEHVQITHAAFDRFSFLLHFYMVS